MRVSEGQGDALAQCRVQPGVAGQCSLDDGRRARSHGTRRVCCVAFALSAASRAAKRRVRPRRRARRPGCGCRPRPGPLADTRLEPGCLPQTMKAVRRLPFGMRIEDDSIRPTAWTAVTTRPVSTRSEPPTCLDRCGTPHFLHKAILCTARSPRRDNTQGSAPPAGHGDGSDPIGEC